MNEWLIDRMNDWMNSDKNINTIILREERKKNEWMNEWMNDRERARRGEMGKKEKKKQNINEKRER
jgi:hypothetical protein